METNIRTFEVEEWMDNHETSAKYNIAETCVASISPSDLLSLSENQGVQLFDPSKKLTYGSIRGSKELKANIAELYTTKGIEPLPDDNILITSGAIAANLLVFYALLKKGDHVICHYPSYQQLYEVPASLGAEVDLWRAREEQGWLLDIEQLKRLTRPNTKMIIINNPHNPTGAIIPSSTLKSLIDLASTHSPPITILSDEVYRPLFHTLTPDSSNFPPSILSLSYANTIATGSLSKAYSLAGIRVGWIAARSAALVEACARARHCTAISVSQLDDRVASVALSPKFIHALLARNIAIARMNVRLLEKWVGEHASLATWAKPVAGTTAFVKFERKGQAVDDELLCERIFQETGLLLAPGSKCFGGGKEFKGYVRFGFCCETKELRAGLEVLGLWIRECFEQISNAKATDQ